MPASSTAQGSARLAAALQAIDERNALDPHREHWQGRDIAKEVLYSMRMSERLQQFAPTASEALRIAAHAQHIQRWRIARDDYPKTRAGYLKWRRDLGRFHADTMAGILADLAYEPTLIERVKSLLMKQNLRQDAEAQALEDVICLVFLEHYLDDFAAQHERDKIISIIQKTWGKMSAQGQQAALALPLSPTSQQLVSTALAATASK